MAFEDEEDRQIMMFLRLIRKMLQWNPQGPGPIHSEATDGRRVGEEIQ